MVSLSAPPGPAPCSFFTGLKRVGLLVAGNEWWISCWEFQQPVSAWVDQAILGHAGPPLAMSEHEPPYSKPGVPQFGEPLPQHRAGQPHAVAPMFPDGQDLPLFSGTPVPVVEKPFVPEDHSMKQAMLPDMPGIDYDQVLARDKKLQRRRPVPLPAAGEIFIAASLISGKTSEPPSKPADPPLDQPRKQQVTEAHHLREAIAPYLSLPKLRHLAALGETLTQAFTGEGEIPPEVQALLTTLAALLHPTPREQIRSPHDIAALLMIEMGFLDQEQMRVICLNTKSRLQKIHLVYQGSLNSSLIRVGELFREPLKLNSAAVIIAHNHPSGEPDPSPEDVLVTREIVAAGKLLDVDVLDHLVIGQGKWVSLRERRLGFDS